MIIPDRFMDLDHSVLRVSSIILKEMNKKKILGYEELMKYLLNKTGDKTRFIFLPSLNFLFLLGKIEYYIKTDSIELIE